MPRSVVTFLMFDGRAEEALETYRALFEGSKAGPIERWPAGGPAPEGTVKRATLTLAGHELVFFDSPVKHAFTFTPAISLFVECESEAELDRAYARLSEGGAVLMAAGDHGFSKKFGWVNDRFGVSWQLNWS